MNKINSIILILAFLLLHPDLSFARTNRNEAGFVTNLPVYMEVFRSTSSYSRKVTDKVKWMDWHAPEIIRDLDCKWDITLCGYEPERNGFSVWPLYWNDYLADSATSVLTPLNN